MLPPLLPLLHCNYNHYHHLHYYYHYLILWTPCMFKLSFTTTTITSIILHSNHLLLFYSSRFNFKFLMFYYLLHPTPNYCLYNFFFTTTITTTTNIMSAITPTTTLFYPPLLLFPPHSVLQPGVLVPFSPGSGQSALSPFRLPSATASTQSTSGVLLSASAPVWNKGRHWVTYCDGDELVVVV